MSARSLIEEPYEIEIPCIRVEQPIGFFFVASIPANVLRQITFSDIRRMTGDREVDTYLGIQREVDVGRVKEIQRYVTTVDACFPTSVILAIEERCAEYDEGRRLLTLRSIESDGENAAVNRLSIAKVLDGQHRIEGLQTLPSGAIFNINVSIFVDMDIASQAYLFSIVNLAQTKVKRSLVYDLFEYSRARSPQKTAHNIAVALDQLEDSPLFRRIKRLGTATRGRVGETLTQAAFVEALLDYITPDPVGDRDTFQRGKRPTRATEAEEREYIFRNLFLDEDDMKIADILIEYFKAVRMMWPVAWDNAGTGYVLAKTTGFRGLMRLLKPSYLRLAKRIGDVPTAEDFFKLFSRSKIKDEQFVNTRFLPGSGGESALFRTLRDEMFPQRQKGEFGGALGLK